MEAVEVKVAVEDLLTQRRRGREPDFIVRTQEELANTFTATNRTMTLLLACIASVSLIVGGIGIMNIMPVSVTERTREIGIRLAIGAQARQVLLQFLVEAVVLSLLTSDSFIYRKPNFNCIHYFRLLFVFLRLKFFSMHP